MLSKDDPNDSLRMRLEKRPPTPGYPTKPRQNRRAEHAVLLGPAC